MKNRFIIGRMKKVQPVLLTLVAIVGVCGVFLPSISAAETQCGLATTTAEGFAFSSYDVVERSSDGLLKYHFRNQTAGHTFTVTLSFQDDLCVNLQGATVQRQITLPPGVTDWSVRFGNMTEVEIWNDQTSAVVSNFTIPEYPGYTRTTVTASSPAAFTNRMVSRTVRINEQRPGPPIVESSVDTPPGCPAFSRSGNGTFFSDYQRAEYVNGLLRVHLRFGTPTNSSLQFFRSVGVWTANCSSGVAVTSSQNTYNDAPTLYYSFRMTSPTTWALWDDEHDRAFPCPVCSGTIPTSTVYVSFTGDIGSGFSHMQTTPFPPTIATSSPGCTVNCYDNVMFLPGIESSRLFAPLSDEENQIWEPDSPLGNDIPSLDMTTAHATDNVYAKNSRILDVAYRTYPVYRQFIDQMNALKSAGVINDWQPIAYDWRLDYADLVENGHETPEGKIYYRGANAATSSDPYILQELKRLTHTSKSGKVSIIAHSNGGLLAKALINKLGSDSSKYVNKIILVASPQLGTPQAIGGLLHGYNQALPFESFPLFVTDADARYLALQMPMAYNLLPSDGYFQSTQNPAITFDAKTLPDWTQKYGSSITTETQLRAFISDTARPKPSRNDLNTPEIGNDQLFGSAINTHTSLDSWTPPTGIQFITIAGWGNPTVASIDYKKVAKYVCVIQAPDGSCALNSTQQVITYSPRMVVDGDGTVVGSSAQAGGTAKYWINLLAQNAAEGSTYIHSNLLESGSTRSLLHMLITNANSLPPYVSTVRPVYDGSAPRLYFTLHSPLTLGFTDSSGKYTGSKKDGTADFNVPGVEYRRFGEVQWLSIPQPMAGKLLMQGMGSGSFALDIQDVNGSNVNSSASFAAVPSSTSTIATITIDPTKSITESGQLALDINGDGAIDTTLQPKPGETVVPFFYSWSGFLQPINDTTIQPTVSQSIFKAGSTVPVKFQLKDSAGNILQSVAAPAWLPPMRISSLSGTVNEAAITDAPTSGGTFKYDANAKQYIYNWSTKGLSGGLYKISAKLDDGTVKAVIVGLK